MLVAFALAGFAAIHEASGYYYQVTSTADDGNGVVTTSGHAGTTADPYPATELRAAISSASSGSTVEFAPGLSGSTIYLTTGQLNVTQNLTIIGLGANQLAVDGSNTNSVFYIAPGTTVSISGLTIQHGAGIESPLGGLYGGGIYNDHGTLIIAYCTVSGNWADTAGGIYNDGESGAASLQISNSTFSRNSAGYGGGIYSDGDYNGNATVQISNSTLSGNSGGGIYNDGQVSGTASLQISNSTLSGNSGGGIASNANTGGSVTVEIGNTILASSGGRDISNFEGTINSAGYNLIDDTSYLLNGTNDQNGVNAKLGPLQNNGGPTFTCALLPGSPAIDQGNRDTISVLDTNIDQRGYPRPGGSPGYPIPAGGDGTCIGAYELQPSAPGVTGLAATQISGTGATLSGTVSVNGAPVAVTFQYSIDPTLTANVTTTAAQTLSSGTYSADVSQPVTGLAYNTTYYFEITGSTSAGVTSGTSSFTTLAGTPTANGQSVDAAKNTSTGISLTGTDPDVPPLPLTYTVVTFPSYGTLSGSAPSLNYTPNTGYSGPDSFNFTVSNGTNTSGTATVSIMVGIGSPIAIAQDLNVSQATAVTLTGTDPDVPPLPLTYAVANLPLHGTLSGAAPYLTYKPAAGYNGTDSFTFTVSNGVYTSAAATVTLTVDIDQWVVTGTSPSGGKLIAGSLTPGALGPGLPLSANGGDEVTVNGGAIVTSTAQDAVEFATSNDQLLNDGTLAGINGTSGLYLNLGAVVTPAYSGLSFLNAPVFLNETITNNGTITGGNGYGPIWSGADGNNGSWALIMTGSTLREIEIVNTGSIAGGSAGGSGMYGSYGGNGADALLLAGTSSVTTLTIVSSGTLAGGGGSGAGWAGTGGSCINLSGSAMNGIEITNSGVFAAGGGGGGDEGGNGGRGLILSGSFASNVELSNSGTITGGAGGGYTGFNIIGNYGSGGDGMALVENSATNVTILNSGTIDAGNMPAPGGGLGGNGINLNVLSLSGLTVVNHGTIAGGFIGGDGFLFSGSVLDSGIITNTATMAGGIAGCALRLGAGQSIDNITIINGGVATGGNGSSYDMLVSGGPGQDAISLIGSSVGAIVISNTGSLTGGNGGDGIYKAGGSGGSGLDLGGSQVVGITVTNDNTVTGGNGATGEYSSGNGGPGMEFYGSESLAHIDIVNGGIVTGGSGGDGNGSGGPGIYLGSAPAASVTVLTLNNSGSILGGNGTNQGGSGGDGVYFTTGSSGNLMIDNHGTITGGAAASGGAPGVGVHGNQNGLVFNNWGAISAGTGSNAVAVSFSGNYNTLNLLGRSTISGLIQSTGSNNVLNFNFSGIDLAASTAIHAALATYLNGKPSTGSVTVLGTTYSWSSFIVEWNVPILPSFGTVRGSYRGLAAIGGTDTGIFTLSLALSGRFTSRVILEDASYSIRGAFNSNGTFNGTFNLGATTLDVALIIDSTLPSPSVSGTITATTARGTDSYIVEGGLLDNIKADGLPPGFAGRYSVIIPTVSGTGPAVPTATGYGTMVVGPRGAITIAGKLGDGTPFTAGSQLDADGKTWTLFKSLYARKNPGCIGGTMTYEDLPDSDCDGALQWIKPAQPGTTYYPGGFSMMVDLQAAKYAAPPLKTGMGTFTLGGGDLPDSAITDSLMVSSRERVIVTGTNGVTLTLTPTTGALSGKFLCPATNKKTPFSGVIYQKPMPTGFGLFIGTDQCGEVEITQ